MRIGTERIAFKLQGKKSKTKEKNVNKEIQGLNIHNVHMNTPDSASSCSWGRSAGRQFSDGARRVVPGCSRHLIPPCDPLRPHQFPSSSFCISLPEGQV